MNFRVNSSLSYIVNAPTTFIFNVHALRSPNQTVLEEKFVVEPALRVEEYTSHDGSSRFTRIKVHEPSELTISYSALVDMRYKILDESNSPKLVPIVELDSFIASFLYPSRYCQSDKLGKFSFKQFGHYKTVYDKVLAISNWIHDNIEYVTGSTDASTSAMDTITERAGVCRDFAHLGIALCRALSIPARYFTGYAYQLKPPDFHACMEAYIDGNWVIFDSTKLAPLNGLVKIATGRDAADAAVASIFGNAKGTAVSVACEVMGKGFQPFRYSGKQKGISFL